MSNFDESLKESKKVVISSDDCVAALDFWKQFDIPMLPEFEQAVHTFRDNPTFENQQELKYQLCKAITTTDHEAFNDEMFKKIRQECETALYNMQFDRDLEQTLTEEKSE